MTDYKSQISHLTPQASNQRLATEGCTESANGVVIETKGLTKRFDDLVAVKPKAVVLSGGPASVYHDDAPTLDARILTLGIPVLGICYGYQLMAHLTGGEVAVLCLLDPGKEMTVAATSGSVEALVARPQAVIRDFTLAAAGAAEAATLHEGCECPFLQPQFRHSHLAVPLRIGDRVLGVLCVGHRGESRFGEEEARLLTLLANAGAIALENARGSRV